MKNEDRMKKKRGTADYPAAERNARCRAGADLSAVAPTSKRVGAKADGTDRRRT
jgi:hypothetical protein